MALTTSYLLSFCILAWRFLRWAGLRVVSMLSKFFFDLLADKVLCVCVVFRFAKVFFFFFFLRFNIVRANFGRIFNNRVFAKSVVLKQSLNEIYYYQRSENSTCTNFKPIKRIFLKLFHSLQKHNTHKINLKSITPNITPYKQHFTKENLNLP